VFIGSQGGLRLLDVEARALLGIRFPGDGNPLAALATSADGRFLAGATLGGDIHLWRTGWREWLAEACGRLKGHDLFADLATSDNSADHRVADDACARRVWNHQAEPR